jgi:hypothetical protein
VQFINPAETKRVDLTWALPLKNRSLAPRLRLGRKIPGIKDRPPEDVISTDTCAAHLNWLAFSVEA